MRYHRALDETLVRCVETGNHVSKLIQHDETKAGAAVVRLSDAVGAIDKLLKKRLADEEDLAVPILLHYKPRGGTPRHTVPRLQTGAPT